MNYFSVILLVAYIASTDCNSHHSTTQGWRFPSQRHLNYGRQHRHSFGPPFQREYQPHAERFLNGKYQSPEEITNQALDNLYKRLQITGRIRGGHNAYQGEVPYQLWLNIYTPTSGDGKRYCGAVLVTVNGIQLALTAAHCVYNITSAFIVAGEQQRSTLAYEQYRDVKKVYMHKGFNGDHARCGVNDNALVFFKNPFQINRYVSTIALPWSDWVQPAHVFISGWGSTVSRELKPYLADKLQVGWTSTVGNDYCKRFESLRCRITLQHLCTLQAGIGPCLGDSGGPAAAREDSTGHWYLAGIFSTVTSDCASDFYPATWMRVSEYIDWIRTSVSRHAPRSG